MSLQHAATFRALHQKDAAALLVLPNCWDAMSARVIEDAGALAIATTSSGVSWSLGRPDGHGVRREEMVDAVRRVADAVSVPVTADVEGGYGIGAPSDAAETVRAIIGAGAVGINLEDTPGDNGDVMLSPARQAARIAAARAAADDEGVPLFINARVDVFLRQFGPGGERFGDTVARALAYLDAGADGIFVPGVIDATTIEGLASAIDAPLNVMSVPGAPDTHTLRKLGVRRVSVGPMITLAVMSQIRRIATEVLGAGTYGSLRDGLPFAEANGMFVRRV